MAKAKPELNATAASILGFLQTRPMTGFELMTLIEDVIGDFWHVTKSQIYRELKILADADLVDGLKAGARDKQPYAITESGRAAFRAWIRQKPTPPIMRLPIVLEVFFGASVPFDELKGHVAAMREHHGARLRVYETFEKEATPGTWPHEALRLGFMFQRAMVEWLESLPKHPLAPKVEKSPKKRAKKRSASS